jgi:hypothetical protein
MKRTFATTLLAAGAVVAASALAFADETTVIEKRVETQPEVVQHETVVVPQPEVQKKTVERTVTTEQPVVQKRTDTVVTTHEERESDE